MEPTRNTNATLVDLLDRVLDKGLVIHADLIVSVAGIPLIGVNLRAALAGMETMLKYGMMQAWDERIRAWEEDYRSKKKSSLIQGEEIALKMLGAYHSSEGIYTAWRYGYLYLTDERLFLYHEHFGEVLFEAPLEKIRGLVIREGEHFTDKKVREELYLLLEGGKACRLTALNVHQLKEALEKRMEEAGLALQEDSEVPVVEGNAAEFLADGEQVICMGKMWYLMDKEGITDDTWRPGHLYLTDKRVCWYYDLARRVAIEIPVNGIIGSVMETRARSNVMAKEKVMDILYASNGARRVATFSGPLLEDWNQIVNKIITGQGESQGEEETETCPQCGRRALIKELLEEGCTSFAVLIVDPDGIDITDIHSIRFTINDNETVDQIDLDDTRDVWVRVTKLDKDEEDTAVTRLWAAYHRAEDHPSGNAYSFDTSVNVTVDAKDRLGSEMSQQGYSFKIETETEHNEAQDPRNLPDTDEVGLDDPDLEDLEYSYNTGIQVISGDLGGARIIYNDTEPVQPTFGPSDEIPCLSLTGVAGVGVPMNLQPPTVFTTPVKLFIPCPGVADLSNLSVYYYNGRESVLACNADGQVLPGAECCIVPGSRRDHPETDPPTIEIKVYHFSAFQAAADSVSSDDQTAGGGGGGCFIGTIFP